MSRRRRLSRPGPRTRPAPQPRLWTRVGWPMKGATFVHQPLRPTASSVPRPSPLRGRLTTSLRYTINNRPTTTKHHATKVFCDLDHTTVARITQVRRRYAIRTPIFHTDSIEAPEL